LVPLPESFSPTKEEEDLLAAYETMRACEKEAARIKEQAAKAKLAAADAKYRQSMEVSKDENATPLKKKKARKKKNNVYTEEQLLSQRGGEHQSDDTSNEEESDEDDNEDPQSLHERREAKLAEMRTNLEEAKQNEESEAVAAEEALRAQLLATTENEAVDTGPSLKRKRQEPPTEKSSLIANLANQATPPRDFSQKLGLKSYAGT
jgi:hypothetical protein